MNILTFVGAVIITTSFSQESTNSTFWRDIFVKDPMGSGRYRNFYHPSTTLHTSDGGTLVAGNFGRTGFMGEYQMPSLIKYDKNGRFEWVIQLFLLSGEKLECSFYDIAEIRKLGDEGYVVVSKSSRYSRNSSKFSSKLIYTSFFTMKLLFISANFTQEMMKFDVFGNLKWCKELYVHENQIVHIHRLVPTQDHFYAMGFLTGSNRTDFILKIDNSNGDLMNSTVFRRTYFDPERVDDVFIMDSFDILENGNLIACASSESEFVTLEISPDLELLSSRRFQYWDDHPGIYCQRVISIKDGGFYVSGRDMYRSTYREDKVYFVNSPLVARFSPYGYNMWIRSSRDFDGIFQYPQETDDNGVILSSCLHVWENGQISGKKQAYARFSPDGEIIFIKSIPLGSSLCSHHNGVFSGYPSLSHGHGSAYFDISTDYGHFFRFSIQDGSGCYEDTEDLTEKVVFVDAFTANEYPLDGFVFTEPLVFHQYQTCNLMTTSPFNYTTTLHCQTGQIQSVYSCFGVRDTYPNVCSRHGKCVLDNTCECEERYFGVNCNLTSCFGVPSIESSVCSGHGSCNMKDECSCFSEYSGNLCNITTCFGIMNSEENVCHGHGLCVSYDSCICDYSYHGKECEVPECYGILQTEDRLVCGGKGVCVGRDDCVCNEGYFGEFCTFTKCYNRTNTDRNVCSNHGVCVGPGECECEEHFIGHECEHEIYICFGLEDTDPLVCSGNGVCMKKNVCVCLDGFDGDFCQLLRKNETRNEMETQEGDEDQEGVSQFLSLVICIVGFCFLCLLTVFVLIQIVGSIFLVVVVCNQKKRRRIPDDEEDSMKEINDDRYVLLDSSLEEEEIMRND